MASSDDNRGGIEADTSSSPSLEFFLSRSRIIPLPFSFTSSFSGSTIFFYHHLFLILFFSHFSF
ncbi:uncharacterized protein DS421_16g560950 [Arachis hypogaea]|nr:uncharacterized protein DS421_16g560950 [Arachis hypogaea]